MKFILFKNCHESEKWLQENKKTVKSQKKVSIQFFFYIKLNPKEQYDKDMDLEHTHISKCPKKQTNKI